jgi:hypothetical protein
MRSIVPMQHVEVVQNAASLATLAPGDSVDAEGEVELRNRAGCCCAPGTMAPIRSCSTSIPTPVPARSTSTSAAQRPALARDAR